MENKYLALLVFFGIVFGIGAGMLIINLTSHSNMATNFCLFEIPDHLAFNCGTNSTVNAFDMRIFEYNNAISEGCSQVPVTIADNYTSSHYEVGQCNLNIPFKRAVIAHSAFVK